MNGERAGETVRQAESATQRTYRHWLGHARRCDSCKHASKAQDGCTDGQELWGVYRLACIGSTS